MALLTRNGFPAFHPKNYLLKDATYAWPTHQKAGTPMPNYANDSATQASLIPTKGLETIKETRTNAIRAIQQEMLALLDNPKARQQIFRSGLRANRQSNEKQLKDFFFLLNRNRFLAKLDYSLSTPLQELFAAISNKLTPEKAHKAHLGASFNGYHGFMALIANQARDNLSKRALKAAKSLPLDS
ncbi:MAG: hypothetical protein VKJ06_05585 [Vampirovibrionales bacterium]|nr:hypothetical protein [Vampirovibrionales bacterium]